MVERRVRACKWTILLDSAKAFAMLTRWVNMNDLLMLGRSFDCFVRSDNCSLMLKRFSIGGLEGPYIDVLNV